MAIETLLLVVTLANGQADLREHNWTVNQGANTKVEKGGD